MSLFENIILYGLGTAIIISITVQLIKQLIQQYKKNKINL